MHFEEIGHKLPSARRVIRRICDRVSYLARRSLVENFVCLNMASVDQRWWYRHQDGRRVFG